MDSSLLVSFFSRRIRILLSLGIVTALGFWLWRGYEGPAKRWVNNYPTGVLYVLFWSLLVFCFTPKRKNSLKIAAGVLAATCLLEFLQLWHPPLLQEFRATWLGQALIGTDFVWGQFPYYFAGALLALLLMRLLAASE
ncbi:MAG: ribosomal maturation YjgA family protein [Planctomycetota bacterium]|jgi:hypothetical protein